MNIDEVKEFFNSFECELLTSRDQNMDDIKSFSSNIQNSSTLEEYLKSDTWLESANGQTCTYLVREPQSKKIVLYFSIKCGLVFSPDEIDEQYGKLGDDEKELVNNFVELLSKNQRIDKVFEDYANIYPNLEFLRSLAKERKRRKNGFFDMDDSNNVIKVDKCYSAIELQYLCRCDDYNVPDTIRFPLGFGLFWQIIVPKIIEISQIIGSEYLYLFAADHSDNKEEQKLIEHYKRAFMFGNLSDFGIILIKPTDNKNCLGLAQPINSLLNCREDAWNKYSDHIVNDYAKRSQKQV